MSWLTQSVQLQFGQDIYLTYQQMDSLSNGLALSILSAGVKRGQLVGIYMDKSVEMFISIIAIHKAGAAFVPLDPDHPPERIQTIIGLAESKIILVSIELQSQLDEVVLGYNVTPLLVDIHRLSPARELDVGHIGRDDISHVLFTSGSTGTPKGIETPQSSTRAVLMYNAGVVTTHGNVIESTISAQELYDYLNDRVLQFSDFTFDVSIWVC